MEQIEEARKNAKWKHELRQINLRTENTRPEEVDLRKLDSSLKKNTAFVRKIKAFTESQKASIEKEISGLNLTKYIGEVAAAVTEAKIKMSDVSAFVEICSIVHQKYAEFGPSLLENWKKLLGKGTSFMMWRAYGSCCRHNQLLAWLFPMHETLLPMRLEKMEINPLCSRVHQF